MKVLFAVILLSGLTHFPSTGYRLKQNSTNQDSVNEKVNVTLIDSLIVYQTENLVIKKLSNHVYVHISYLNTDDFGKVACNGMLVINKNEGVLFDTPTDNDSSIELINFISKELKCKIMALIPTHFHKDCVGGIVEFEKQDIPTYATEQTIELLKTNGQKFSKPIHPFKDSIELNIGNKRVYAQYFGEGHTKDNIVGYFPDDNAVFGGCLIKEVGANKGFLGDANIKEWPKTVEKVKLNYPKAQIVIPGHGKYGKTELFDYTIKLFD